jgi:hypothetical protein
VRANEAASRATTPRVQKLSNEHATQLSARRKTEQSFHVRRNGRAPRFMSTPTPDHLQGDRRAQVFPQQLRANVREYMC